MTFLIGSSLVACFGNTALAVFVFRRTPRSGKNLAFAYMVLCIAVWSIPDFAIEAFSMNPRTALWVGRTAYCIGSFVPALFLWFCAELVGRPSATVLRVSFGVSGLFALLSFTPLLIVEANLELAREIPGPVYPLFSGFFISSVSGGLWALWRALSTAEYKLYNQILYFLGATVASLIALIISIFAVYQLGMPPIHFAIEIFAASVIAYAIVKHQLMDIRVVIRRTVVYSLLTACITAAYFLLILVMEHGFQHWLGYESVLTTVGTALVLAIGFTPLKNRIQYLVDQRLFRASLPELAEERTALQQQLVRTDQLRAVGTFAASMAHEIKNPLSTIKTFVEHFPEKGEDPLFREKCRQFVGQEVSKIDQLVRNVLEFAKPSTPDKQPVDLGGLCDETLDFLQPQLLKHRVFLVKTGVFPAKGEGGAGKRGPTCAVDPTQIKQVLLNLLLNSIEAMPDGGTLTVGLTQDNGTATLSIQDTGPGISDDVLSRLAEPFLTTKEHGTGLGLSIVHSIVDAHSGTVRFVKPAQGGTRVELRFPTEERA